ncbi:Gfo/Idh/MocA family oxidoreductase [Micromonospora rifamycinica]|uniref:Gfo/Idh/MocA family protein n=1 Tax=Micromonospora rifamycinica TaxID=291594 RepID=UPI0033FC0373
MIGTENTHVDQILEYLNVRELAPGTRVVALAGGATERNEQLRAHGGVERIVDAPTELLGQVDAVIITDRHGGLHREHAVPFLAEGLPVFVDKPLACSVADAEAIVAVAREHDALLTSYSALRWIPDTEALVAELPTVGTPQVVVTTGPADEASPYGGIWFYGIHSVDVALRLVPGEIGEVRVERSVETVIARVRVGDTLVVVNLVRPEEIARVPFHAMVVGRTGIAARPLVLDDWYVAPGLEAFLRMVGTGHPPIGYDDLLRPIRVLDAVAAAL